MADTVGIDCAQGVWTEIAEGPLTDCLVTPTKAGFFLYSATQPDEESGHFLDEWENHNAVPEDSSSFWFMSPNAACKVWKSERTPA